MSDSPVILINGARQSGKTTLSQLLFEDEDISYFNFDDFTTLAAVKASPSGFVDALPSKVILDEIQKVPEILPAIKRKVDVSRRTNQFVLTGSANVLALPELSESLAGRMETHTLWPLSQGEIHGTHERFIDRLFAGAKLPSIKPYTEHDLIEALMIGGYPENVGRTSQQRRNAWLKSYIATLLQRDVRDLSDIEGLATLPNLLAIVASRVTGLMNVSDLSRTSGIPMSTLKRYLTLLEMLFLVVDLPPWFGNFGKRLVKSPKLYLNDSALIAYLLGIDGRRLIQDRTMFGHLLENFVVMELMKQCGWSEAQPRLFHFRTFTGEEVDIVLEAADGTICGIEVKASSAVSSEAFKGLRLLKEKLGKKFHHGLVLYTGSTTVSFEKDLTALPVSALWQIS